MQGGGDNVYDRGLGAGWLRRKERGRELEERKGTTGEG